MSRWSLVPIGIIVLSAMLACKKNKEEGRIPDVPVNIEIHVGDPLFTPLNSVGGWTYLNGGSRGIVVFRRDVYDFVSYDRHCTYDVENPCGVVHVERNNQTLLDSCCGSRFYLWDGTVASGPAKYPLKKYHTTFDGQVLRIYN